MVLDEMERNRRQRIRRFYHKEISSSKLNSTGKQYKKIKFISNSDSVAVQHRQCLLRVVLSPLL
jgi:hypothetical protein